MAETKGTIGVTSENIFPIIKRFLYSDHEIFLREIVSNAVDATTKLQTLAKAGDFAGPLGDLTIHVQIDKAARTLTVRDAGLGMTHDEVEQFINQIALSGAESFLEKYKDEASGIIGHFGLGFYSAFMVSDKVEIYTQSYKPGAQPVHWSCQGDPNYTLEEDGEKARGTDVVMHISSEHAEFLEEGRIEALLKKYCRFLPVPIAFGKKKEWKEGKQVELAEDHIINDIAPLWTRKPSDLTEEDYQQFYSDLYPMADKPLFHIHLNVDYPFHLTGILYFPKLKSNFDIQRNRIQLYCNQVFITDSVEDIVPEYLTLLHGVIDSPDIPLNVSRSYLQNDQNVRKISTHITKKVADRLAELFKSDRTQYEAKWDDLKLFITFGMVSDEKFYERSHEFALLKNVEGKYFTLEEYRKLVAPNQTDKEGQVVYLYCTDKAGQWSYIEGAKAKGYDVLLMDGQLDPHLVNLLEQKLEKTRFARVDSNTPEALIRKAEENPVAMGQQEQDTLRGMVTGVTEAQGPQVMVSFQALGANALPAVVTQNEFMRRMRDMQAMSPSSPMFGAMPTTLDLVLNTTHPLIQALAKEAKAAVGQQVEEFEGKIKPLEAQLKALNDQEKDQDEEGKKALNEQREALYKQMDELRNANAKTLKEYGHSNRLLGQIYDLALLSTNQLTGQALSRFVKRSVEIVEEGLKTTSSHA